MKHKLKEHNSDSSHLFFYITNKCNMRCSYCYVGNEKINQGYEIEYIEAKKILLELKKKYNISTITLLGGEPLLYDRIIQLILFAKKLNFTVIVDTNGTSSFRLIDDIISVGTDCLSFSIDSFNESINSKLRSIGLLDKSKYILECIQNRNILKRVTTVLTTLNINEVEEIISQCMKLNVDVLNFHVFLPQGNGRDKNDYLLSKDDYYTLRKAVKKFVEQDISMEIRFPLIWYKNKKEESLLKSYGYTGCLAEKRDSINLYPNKKIHHCSFMIDEEQCFAKYANKRFIDLEDGEKSLESYKHCYYLEANPEVKKYFDSIVGSDSFICPIYKLSSYKMKEYSYEVFME